MKRQLTNDELKLTKKGIERLTEEVSDLRKVHLAEAELTYNYKLDYSYKKQRKQYKEAIDQIKADINAKQLQIKNLQDHVKNGVEIKENKVVG